MRLPRKGSGSQGDSAQVAAQKGGLGATMVPEGGLGDVRGISGYCVGRPPDSGRLRRPAA